MDYRTKREKLEAMANQSASPHEAEIARLKLKDLEEEEKTKGISHMNVNFFWGSMHRYSFTVSYSNMTGVAQTSGEYNPFFAVGTTDTEKDT